MTFSRRGVLIAGAGPTGLTLANCLDVYGVPFTIVDRKAGPDPGSKALAINILSQYQFGLLGRLEKLGADACRVRRLNVEWRGRRLASVDFEWLDSPITTFITQPQAKTERELAGALASRHRVEWNTELVELRDEGDRVCAWLRNPTRGVDCHRFDYVVGCEGGHSLVRDRIGAVLTGRDYPVRLLLADFEMEWETSPDQVSYRVYEDTFFVVVPIGKGAWRVVMKQDAHVSASDDPGREIAAAAARYFGAGRFPSPPVWASQASLYLRTASHLRRGRCLIAGDAAHLYSPIGGTGMNTGMQDAFNLGWKLAQAWRGWTNGDELLASYEEERKEAIEKTAIATDKLTRMIAGLECDARMSAAFWPRMSNRRQIVDTLPTQHSGLGLRYTATRAVCEDLGTEGAVGGEVCRGLLELGVEMSRQSGRRLDPCSGHVLFVASPEQSRRSGADIEQIARELEHLTGSALVSTLVVVGPGADRPRSSRSVLLEKPDLLRRLKVRAGDVLLVRPDAIVGQVGSLSRLSDVTAFAKRLWKPGPRSL